MVSSNPLMVYESLLLTKVLTIEILTLSLPSGQVFHTSHHFQRTRLTSRGESGHTFLIKNRVSGCLQASETFTLNPADLPSKPAASC